MDVREATESDVDGIRRVARASLAESYDVIDERLRDDAVDTWYGESDLAEQFTDDDAVFVVALDDGEVVGFAQSFVVDRGDGRSGEIDWLHIHPDHRGRGIGDQLLKRVETELLKQGVDSLVGRVLEANEDGQEFYEHEEYEPAGEREVSVGDETFVELTYAKAATDESTDFDEVLVESREGPDGQTLYVAYDESERASKEPFYVAYEDPEKETRYGWFCSACGSFDVAMNAMGRAKCSSCGNTRKPTRWDSAHM